MSLLLLIDGYNIAQPIAPGRNPHPGWLQESRTRLLRELSEHLEESVRRKTCVVFDATNPPRDRPDSYVSHEMSVRFAVKYASADDLIGEIIRAHHTPKRLMVVSSDHRVQVAADRRGAKHFDSEPWMDALTDGITHLAVTLRRERNESGQSGGVDGAPGSENDRPKPVIEDPSDVSDWMREFGFDDT